MSQDRDLVILNKDLFIIQLTLKLNEMIISESTKHYVIQTVLIWIKDIWSTHYKHRNLSIKQLPSK